MPLPPAEFIAQKRDGLAHQAVDLEAWIDAFARDQLPDYQMAAWAMAVYLQGMTAEETAVLTRSMLHSGDVLQWEDDGRPVVDKHSTGGVGDKVSLVLAPLLACCEVRVPMISGRGLGPTGGTLDKLESIPGFETQLDNDRLQQIVKQCGCVIAGASSQVAPADKRLYALRDVTATVPSIPLITASIMSKKLAEGLAALVLDVKGGSGAFMQTDEDARRLAHSLVAVGAPMGVKVTALITDMNQPLGRAVGNAIEVDEAVQLLQGRGPDDLLEVTLQLGAELLVSCDACSDIEDGRRRLEARINSGDGLARLNQMVAAQGGRLDAPRPLAPEFEVAAEQEGYVAAIDTRRLGRAVIRLGGGRQRKEDVIDDGVGILMHARLGESVERGQPLARVFARGQRPDALDEVLRAFTISPAPAPPPRLVRERIAS